MLSWDNSIYTMESVTQTWRWAMLVVSKFLQYYITEKIKWNSATPTVVNAIAYFRTVPYWIHMKKISSLDKKNIDFTLTIYSKLGDFLFQTLPCQVLNLRDSMYAHDMHMMSMCVCVCVCVRGGGGGGGGFPRRFQYCIDYWLSRHTNILFNVCL